MGAIEKWRGGNLPAELETKIERWRQRRAEGALEVRRENPMPYRKESPSIAPGAPGEVIWLPRVCALHDEGWIASYIRGANGLFTPVETIRMTGSLWRQHQGSAATRIVDVGDRSQEECPWCGATYRGWAGPVSCSRCRAKVCLGRTTADDYFRCRPSCGGEGKLRPTEAQEIGFTPALFRRGNAGG